MWAKWARSIARLTMILKTMALRIVHETKKIIVQLKGTGGLMRGLYKTDNQCLKQICIAM